MTREERISFISTIATVVSGWGFARVFAECIDKTHFDPVRSNLTIDEQAFEQVISRFETYLRKTQGESLQTNFGLLIHDNNETIAGKHTALMKKFHSTGTFWTGINHIIETPLFVDSQLTSMVQIADLCSYAIRRYIENGERDLFDKIFQRGDRMGAVVVGIRHFARNCECLICDGHRRPNRVPA